MKNAIIMFFALLLASFILSATAAGTTISIGDGTANVDETDIVPLMINDVTGAAGVEINLTFDESVVNVIACTNSDFEIPPQDPPTQIGLGWVVINAGQVADLPLDGAVKICDVTLQAVGSESDTSPLIQIDVQLQDINQQDIPIDALINGTFTISGGPTPTPSPTEPPAGDGGDGVAPTPTTSPTLTPTPSPTPKPSLAPSPTPREEEKTYENITSGEEVTVEILDNELTITFKKNVSGVKITAKELVEKPADIPDAPGIVFRYLEYHIENVSAEDIVKIAIPFDVPKSWIASENIDPVTIKLNRYYEGVWNPLPTKKVGEDKENMHYSAETEGLSIFAITGEKKTEAVAPAPAIWVWGVIGVVLLIVVIAGVWYIKKKRK